MTIVWQTDRQTKKERKTKENSLKMTFVWQTRGVYSYMKVVYICAAQSLGSLGSGPSLKIGGFQSGPSMKNEGGGGTKNNKETYTFKSVVFWSSPCRESGTNKCIFLKRGVFRCDPGRKSGVFRSGPGRKMGGFRAAHTRTALIWEYPPHTHTHTHRADQNAGKIINKWPLFDRQTHRHTNRNERKTKKNSLKMTFVWQTRRVYSLINTH